MKDKAESWISEGQVNCIPLFLVQMWHKTEETTYVLGHEPLGKLL